MAFAEVDTTGVPLANEAQELFGGIASSTPGIPELGVVVFRIVDANQ